MLHLLTEENSELKNKRFPIPDGVRKILQSTLSNYNGDKTVDGYKRLNNLLSSDTISYQELKRIKNFFDNYTGTPQSTEYILNGGEPMQTWVNNTLNTATTAIRDFKQAKKDVGINNAFIKSHEKNRQSKKKNKPTQAKFQTKDVNKNMANDTMLRYESKERRVICITESQSKMLKEAMDDTFSFEELDSIKSFKGRYQYCRQHIGMPCGRGSSRVCFQLDDNRILKLALNRKGCIQNRQEEYTADYGYIFPQVFKSSDNDLWLVSEYVLPAKAKDFPQALGISWDDFCKFITSCVVWRFGNKQRSLAFWDVFDFETWEEMLENEDLCEFDQYIGDYQLTKVGDLKRLCNFGLTTRGGNLAIVLLDSGVNDEILGQYY